MEIVHHHFLKIDSTNTCAKRNAHLFDKEKVTLITADEQFAGRGRAKRIWTSPARENLYASFCFFLPNPRKDLGNISQIMAISAAEALGELGLTASLKWPNDIQIKGKKIGGILSEITQVEDRYCFICGIGLNINMKEDKLSKIEIPATSVFEETGHTCTISQVVEALKVRFETHLRKFFEDGFSSFLESYREKITHEKGQSIRFHDQTQVWEGLFYQINEDGSLTLTLADGTNKVFLAGEILDGTGHPDPKGASLKEPGKVPS